MWTALCISIDLVTNITLLFVIFQPTPRLVKSLSGEGVCQVVAGWGHTAALTRWGKLLMCGRNLKGQLGIGHPDHFPKNERGHPYHATFKEVIFPTNEKCSQVSCGGEHTAVLMENGDIYAYGGGDKGQIGHYNVMEFRPKVLQSLKDMRRPAYQVACGNNCTVFIAGPFKPPSLFQICVDTLKAVPGINEVRRSFCCVSAMHSSIYTHSTGNYLQQLTDLGLPEHLNSYFFPIQDTPFANVA
jgi:hypothetical protein